MPDRFPYVEIKNLGPIEDCSMVVDDFTVLTGAQASGKSTIAKCIYYCRTVKDDFISVVLNPNLKGENVDIFNEYRRNLRYKFLQMFGTSLVMDERMTLKYWYSAEEWIEICIKTNDVAEKDIAKFVMIDFSLPLYSSMIEVIGRYNGDKMKMLSAIYDAGPNAWLTKEINELFHDDHNTIFIPAGRSMITLLSSQLSYFYATMDDQQKRLMDYSTQKYIEYIMKIRPSFDDGLKGLIDHALEFENDDSEKLKELSDQIEKVLKGRYVYRDGKERFYLSESSTSVNINFTSSGQQETVWIFNILAYLLANNTKAFIIVEEPEAHLYPDAQKQISEILAFMAHNGYRLMITTHSPYVLGALNNLIYADHVAKKTNAFDRVNAELPESFWISDYSAYQVEDGSIESCKEKTEEQLIINEVIDGAADDINNLYSKLFDIRYGYDETENESGEDDAGTE